MGESEGGSAGVEVNITAEYVFFLTAAGDHILPLFLLKLELCFKSGIQANC